MIHISYAIAQFFEILLGAILRAVGGAIAIGLLAVLGLAGLVFLARTVRGRRG